MSQYSDNKATELIEQHGKEFMRELLDILFIKGGNLTTGEWRFLLLKHKKIKQTTKIIWDNVFYSETSLYWYVVLQNGRGADIVRMTIGDEEIIQIREELYE